MSAPGRTRPQQTEALTPAPVPQPRADRPRPPLSAPAPLLDTTLDQLRTLVAVHATGTALAAARLLDREQSSVQKQLDTLNRNFREMCGEPLVVKQGRGRDVLFTGTGRTLVDMAHTTLGDWAQRIRDCRSRVDGTLTVGTTRYTLSLMADACADIADELARRGVELKVEHVRTRNFLERLRAKEIDLVCGSVVTRVGADATPGDCEVMELARGDLYLLTNLPADRVPDGPVPVGALPSLPLAVPRSGLIADFLRTWFGPAYRDNLTIAAEIDAVPFGLELLSSRLPMYGCMLVTEGIGRAVREGRIPGGTALRVLPVVDDRGPGHAVEHAVGIFVRKGERERVGPDHPLNLLWDALARRIPRADRVAATAVR
ncbi:LysR family transcriptional regulator [Yinghuangia sp. YIM S09857]|uniref:LysR family transcriptional regulator n=1 Tax=Yinghuangia sp. YIM S09857 TaxID=3436929 RepID=UPI003F53807F